MHRMQIRVYYEDTDFSGLVYHASYLRVMERGRTELLRELGLCQSALLAGTSGEAIFFVVRAMNVDFKRPARMDDMLCVETVTEEVGGASFALAQKIWRGEELLVVAKVAVACVENGRARRLPPQVKEKFDRLLYAALGECPQVTKR